MTSVFAAYLNVKPSLVNKWERGEKRPQAASLKLLSLVARKGLVVVAWFKALASRTAFRADHGNGSTRASPRARRLLLSRLRSLRPQHALHSGPSSCSGQIAPSDDDLAIPRLPRAAVLEILANVAFHRAETFGCARSKLIQASDPQHCLCKHVFFGLQPRALQSCRQGAYWSRAAPVLSPITASTHSRDTSSPSRALPTVQPVGRLLEANTDLLLKSVIREELAADEARLGHALVFYRARGRREKGSHLRWCSVLWILRANWSESGCLSETAAFFSGRSLELGSRPLKSDGPHAETRREEESHNRVYLRLWAS